MATGWKSSYYRYKELFLNVSTLYKKRGDLRAFLEIVLSIVAVIIFLMFALKPTFQTIISLTQQIKEEKATLSALNLKLTNLQKANSLMAQNSNYLTNIDIAVSSEPKPENFMKQIQGLAAKNGVSLVSMSINDVVLVGKPKLGRSSENTAPLPENAYEMGYSVSLKGAFANIDGFLKDLENLRSTSVIDSLTISSSVTETGRVIVAVISGRVPFVGNN